MPKFNDLNEGKQPLSHPCGLTMYMCNVPANTLELAGVRVLAVGRLGLGLPTVLLGPCMYMCTHRHGQGSTWLHCRASFRWIPWCQMEVIFVCLSGIDEESVELA